MRKFSKFGAIAVLASSLVSSAVAANLDGFFVGAEGKYNFKSQIKSGYGDATGAYKFDADDSLFALGLKVGYDFDLFRVYGVINHNFEAKDSVAILGPALGLPIPEELKWSGNDFVLGADWTPKFSLAGLDFKGIVGAFAGTSKINVKYFAQYSTSTMTSDYSQDGFIYGLKLGGIYEINQNNEIEFGLKYDKAKYDDKNVALNMSGTLVPMTAKDTKRTNLGVFVGYNYKF
nr:hypothetical protein [Campylobacter sp.]